MTAKGIAQLRKKYAHVAKMEPQSLKIFEGQLREYINIQEGAVARTRKEYAIAEVTPALNEARDMHRAVLGLIKEKS